MSSNYMILTIHLDKVIGKFITTRIQTLATDIPDIFIYHDHKAQDLHIHNSTQELIFKIPLKATAYYAYSDTLDGLEIAACSPLGRLIANYMLTLALEIHSFSDETKEHTINNLLQLLSINSFERKQTSDTQEFRGDLDVDAATLLRIKQFIAANIYDPELSPEYLAKEFNHSLRYLYYIFENEKLSVAKYIKETRLMAAKNRIISTVKSGKTISEIAYDVGFNNISHFCRVFKEKFNETPLEMKQRYTDSVCQA